MMFDLDFLVKHSSMSLSRRYLLKMLNAKEEIESLYFA